MNSGINPDFVDRMSVSWNEGRFETVHNMMSEYCRTLRQDIDRSQPDGGIEHIEKAARRLSVISAILADMDAFRAAQAAGESAWQQN